MTETIKYWFNFLEDKNYPNPEVSLEAEIDTEDVSRNPNQSSLAIYCREITIKHPKRFSEDIRKEIESEIHTRYSEIENLFLIEVKKTENENY